jgi:hypothetical protein
VVGERFAQEISERVSHFSHCDHALAKAGESAERKAAKVGAASRRATGDGAFQKALSKSRPVVATKCEDSDVGKNRVIEGCLWSRHPGSEMGTAIKISRGAAGRHTHFGAIPLDAEFLPPRTSAARLYCFWCVPSVTDL